MINRLKRIARRVLNALPGGNTGLQARVERLEQELDEYRRDSLRVAEMLDLLEHRLTPDGAAEKGEG